MNSEWLRYYVTLAETRNVHATAERLHVTPQAVSKALSGLEQQLKVTLVDRDHRIRNLTPAGEMLLEEARTILHAIDNAQRRIDDWQTSEPQGPVTIAGDMLWHHHLMPALLADLVEQYNGLCPQLFEMLPDDAEHWVATGDVDVGLLLRPPRRSDLHWATGIKSPYVIAGKPQPMRSWQEFGYVVPRFFKREFPDSLDGWPERKFPRRIAAKVELLETAIALAEAGVGVAFLPELAVRDRLDRGSLAIVAEAPCEFSDDLYVIWRKGVVPTPGARAVLRALGAVS